MSTRVLDISSVGYDPKYYPRANGREDWVTVCRYVSALKADPKKQFPPIVVVKALGMKVPWLILDGLHRVRAYHKAEREKIPAVVERLPRSRWLARSVELNITHGRVMDDGDKAWSAMRLREDGYADDKIAALLCMPIDRLERIIVDRVVRIETGKADTVPYGRSKREVDGKHYGFLKAPFLEQELSPAEEVEALKEQAPVASNSVLNILDSAIALLNCGVDMTREDICERIMTLKTLVCSLAGK